jgi:hypothetical protein
MRYNVLYAEFCYLISLILNLISFLYLFIVFSVSFFACSKISFIRFISAIYNIFKSHYIYFFTLKLAL